MTLAEPKNLLGVGLYTPAEAALYAKLRTATLKRWVFGNRQGEPVIDNQLDSDEHGLVSFLDFTQTLAVRAIRRKRKVPLNKIRDAVKSAEDKYGLSYPLARKNRLYLFAGNEVLIELDDERTVQLTGKNKDHLMLSKVVTLYLDNLSFNEAGLANSFEPFPGIKLDPNRRFGEPMVEGTGYSANALWEARLAEGSEEDAAKAMGVTEEQVKTACWYIDSLHVAA